VTIIPITWDTDEIAYFVGFQVDLVEQPNAILEKVGRWHPSDASLMVGIRRHRCKTGYTPSTTLSCKSHQILKHSKINNLLRLLNPLLTPSQSRKLIPDLFMQ
jgi:hypothetical protein